MKKFLFLVLFMGFSVQAQTLPAGRSGYDFSGVRLLAGVSGGVLLNNQGGGGVVTLEIPLGKQVSSCYMPGHTARKATEAQAPDGKREGQLLDSAWCPGLQRFEADFQDTFATDSHPPLGVGWQNQVDGRGILWLTQNFGISSGLESSRYSVKQVSKMALYTSDGLVLMKRFSGVPTKIVFSYLREFHNGLQNGVESSHAQGGKLEVQMQVTPRWRITDTFVVAHILQQGNSACDGSGAPNPLHLLACPRRGSVGGGASMSVQYIWGKGF